MVPKESARFTYVANLAQKWLHKFMVVDMSKMTCSELTKLGFQDFAGITMWLSGYYNASVRNTVIDLYQFAQAAKTVKDYCATAPRATVMSGAERALGIKMPRPR